MPMGWYMGGAIALSILSLIRVIHKFGNGSFLLELVYFFTCLTCLVMPVVGYVFFPRSNPIANLWVKYMPVPEEYYFVLLIPSCLAISLAFFLFRGTTKDDSQFTRTIMTRIKSDMNNVPTGVIRGLYFSSLFAYNIATLIPDSLKQINNFLYFSFYTALFYIYNKKEFPKRFYYLAGGILFILLDALNSGMFTIIAYMSGIFIILYLADKKIKLLYRILIIGGALLAIVYLQLFKLNWRQDRWQNKQGESNAILMSLKVYHASPFESIMFPIYVRANQGFNIGLVQRRIPNRVDFIGGEHLLLTFISSFVPRIFWPDKPEAGGKENMKLYTGITLKGWSTNVGPIGEAYGSFGTVGGSFYIFLFGLFIRFSYLRFLRLCTKNSLLFLWMPVLFFQIVYVMETDSLQAFNSLLKGALFIFLLKRFVPTLFPKHQHESHSHREGDPPILLQHRESLSTHS